MALKKDNEWKEIENYRLHKHKYWERFIDFMNWQKGNISCNHNTWLSTHLHECGKNIAVNGLAHKLKDQKIESPKPRQKTEIPLIMHNLSITDTFSAVSYL